MNAATESVDSLLGKKGKASAILVIVENDLAAVAAQDDVAEHPRMGELLASEP